MQIGQPFNPFRLFTGIFIPEGLVRANALSPGAKLTYGRLVRYAGQDGERYPAVPTLAAEIGVSVRQTQYYLAELEREKLIRRVTRIADGGQTSNSYQFLWHPVLGIPVKEIAPEGVQDLAPKESQIEESHSKESHNCDLDYPPTNRKKRDSRLAASSRAVCKQHPRLQEALAEYMTTLGDERIYPSARLVVDIMDAAGGRSEDEVIACLRYLREERGLRPGTKRGPRHFSWFKTVVADYFAQKRDREYVTGNGPVAAVAGALHDGDPGMIDLGMAASRTMRQLLVGASTRNSNGCAIGRPRSRGGRLLEVWDHPWPHKYKSPPRQKPGGPVGKEPDATWC